jgi:hypothetical protein
MADIASDKCRIASALALRFRCAPSAHRCGRRVRFTSEYGLGGEGGLVADTARVQYAFFDVVAFTHDRSVEAQSDIVEALNNAVRGTVIELDECEDDSIVYIPTGDGMAVGVFNPVSADITLRLALGVLGRVAEHNAAEADSRRRFEVRVGLNENTDNIVTDINGTRNVAGAGISMCQRIMDKADGGEVLVGETLYLQLAQRERYMASFRDYSAIGKHGVRFGVHQYVGDAPGLIIARPTAFQPVVKEAPKLTLYAAYFIAHAWANREFLGAANETDRDYVGTVLLSMLAKDSEDRATSLPFETPIVRTRGPADASFSEKYDIYDEIDFWVLAELSDAIGSCLRAFRDCFVESFRPHYVFVTPRALERLCSEQPSVAAEFGIAGPSEE